MSRLATLLLLAAVNDAAANYQRFGTDHFAPPARCEVDAGIMRTLIVSYNSDPPPRQGAFAWAMISLGFFEEHENEWQINLQYYAFEGPKYVLKGVRTKYTLDGAELSTAIVNGLPVEFYSSESVGWGKDVGYPWDDASRFIVFNRPGPSLAWAVWSGGCAGTNVMVQNTAPVITGAGIHLQSKSGRTEVVLLEADAVMDSFAKLCAKKGYGKYCSARPKLTVTMHRLTNPKSKEHIQMFDKKFQQYYIIHGGTRVLTITAFDGTFTTTKTVTFHSSVPVSTKPLPPCGGRPHCDNPNGNEAATQ